MSKRTAKVVEYILRERPITRSSDNELIIDYLQLEGAGLTIQQADIIRKLNFESITRCRRKIQEEGKYLPNPEVARQRRLKGMIVQQNMPTTSSEGVPPLIEQQPQDRHPNWHHGHNNPR